MIITSLADDGKNGVNLDLPALAHQALHETRTWYSMTFLFHINPQIQWHEMSVFEKIYYVINKMCTFKFENLTIFIAFPSPSVETETIFHGFQSDLACKRTW